MAKLVFLRFFSVLISTLVCFGLIWFDRPATLQSLRQSARILVQDLLYRKTLFIEGQEIVTDAEIKAVLPTERTVPWWLFSRRKIRERLERLPYVAVARVSRCHSFSWSCFILKLEEHVPDFLALIDDQVWVVAADGSFIVPVSSRAEVDRIFSANARQIKGDPLLVSGIFAHQASPEVVEARARYVRRAVSIIEEHSGFDVRAVSILDNAELTVDFDSLQPRARFDFGEVNLDRLADEAVRFRKVIDELGPRTASIREIDLAFNRLAVVKPLELRSESH